MLEDAFLRELHGKFLIYTLVSLCYFFTNDNLLTLHPSAPSMCDDVMELIHYTIRVKRAQLSDREEWKRCFPLQDNYQCHPKIEPNMTRELGELILYDILGACKIRVGSIGDGGYIVLDQGLDETEEVFSFGVANDILLEVALQKQYPNI